MRFVKKNQKTLVWLLLICLVSSILVPVMSLVALAEPAFEKAKAVKVSRITLNTDEESLEPKERVKLVATVFPANATNKQVAWSSSKKAVATVSAAGLVIAKKPGETVITCKAKDGSGKQAVCYITVEAIEVEDIRLSKSSITLVEGKRQVLKATIKPANATNKKVRWSSDNSAVASVASNGKVTAKSAGEATITCEATDGSGVEAICDVTVKAKVIPVTSVVLDQTSVTTVVGQSVTLRPTILPANATNRSLVWSTSNAGVASVNNGLVTAVGVGSAAITCTATGGNNVQAICNITVNPNIIPVSSVLLSQTSASVLVDRTLTLTASVFPGNATDQRVVWSTSNAAVASVENGVVRGVSLGAATITCTSVANPAASASATISVTLPTYRALLIGQPGNAGTWAHNSMITIRRMLNNFRHSSQTYYLHEEENLTRNGILDRLSQLPRFYGETGNITENDVTVVYYAGDAVTAAETQNMIGAWVGADGDSVRVDEIVALLDNVPGTVIVIADCLRSGQIISSRDYHANDAALKAEMKRSNQAFISAFARSAKGVTDSPVSGKYKVITSTSAYGDDYAARINEIPLSLFGYAVGLGGGYNAPNQTVINMLADRDGNNIVTLQEMYIYVNVRVMQLLQDLKLTGQSVQYWPINDTTPIVRRTD